MTIVFAFVLHLPYPLALGVLVAVLEVITFIGPIIAGVIVAIVALSAGGLPLAIAAVVFLFVLRQIEDVLIMPAVLGRAVDLHPLVALFAVVVASTAFGIVGHVPRRAGRGRHQRGAARVLPRGVRQAPRGPGGRRRDRRRAARGGTRGLAASPPSAESAVTVAGSAGRSGVGSGSALPSFPNRWSRWRSAQRRSCR